VTGIMTSVKHTCPVIDLNGVASTTHFHHLSFHNFLEVIGHFNIFAWQTALQNAGLSLGTLHVVTGAGIGRCTMEVFQAGPFM